MVAELLNAPRTLRFRSLFCFFFCAMLQNVLNPHDVLVFDAHHIRASILCIHYRHRASPTVGALHCRFVPLPLNVPCDLGTRQYTANQRPWLSRSRNTKKNSSIGSEISVPSMGWAYDDNGDKVFTRATDIEALASLMSKADEQSAPSAAAKLGPGDLGPKREGANRNLPVRMVRQLLQLMHALQPRWYPRRSRRQRISGMRVRWRSRRC